VISEYWREKSEDLRSLKNITKFPLEIFTKFQNCEGPEALRL
jgi:hypothetical protein